MPTYDYKCKECGEVFELFRHLSEIDGAVKCPHCGSIKTQKLFSTPQIRGETVAGSGYGKTLSPQVNRSTATGIDRGLRGGRGGGRGMGRGWRRSQ